MKDKIRSLLGIEMSLNGCEFKPFILILGILLFIGLSIPLLLVYSFLYVKNTLLNQYKELIQEHKLYNRNKKKWFCL